MSIWEIPVIATEKSRSSIQAFLKFPIVVITSTTLSTLLHTLALKYADVEEIVYWKPLNSWQEIAVLLGWRIFELGLEWFAGYDSYDVIALTILSHGPSLYLLVAFYDVSLVAILPLLLIDSIVVFVSFRLVRPLSSLRFLSSRRGASSRVANSDILSSITIQAYTILLASLVYAIAIFTAYRTYLPSYLITYFENLPRISAVHSPFYVTLFPTTILVGLAIKTFIFTPAVAISTEDDQDIFDAETASFWETLWFNIWGYNERTKLVIKRTVVIMIICGISTFLHTFLTIDGVEFMGSIAYTASTISASGLSSIALGLVAAAA